jgi:hypothetical protein
MSHGLMCWCFSIHPCYNKKLLKLSRHQCVGIVYNSVTNKLPFFFYSVYQINSCTHIQKIREDYPICPLPTWDYGITALFGRSYTRKIAIDKALVPQRQPHNGTCTRDLNILMSITNLIRMTNQFCFLDGKESK